MGYKGLTTKSGTTITSVIIKLGHISSRTREIGGARWGEYNGFRLGSSSEHHGLRLMTIVR